MTLNPRFSFELFTKHLVREIAHEGHLQLVIPIGRDVEKAITKEKLEDAVRVPGVKDHARVVNAFPAVSVSLVIRMSLTAFYLPFIISYHPSPMVSLIPKRL
jgi:hypothetical protein